MGYVGLDGGAITEDQVRDAIMNGKGYAAILSQLATGAANAFVGIQLIANNISKNILVYRATAFQSQAAGDNRLYLATNATQDAGLTAAITPVNLGDVAIPSALTAIQGSPAATTEVAGFQGSQFAIGGGAANSLVELLTQGLAAFIPKGAQGSISIYSKVVTSANSASLGLYWVEI